MSRLNAVSLAELRQLLDLIADDPTVYYVPSHDEITVAAYYLAEKDGFALPPETYWHRGLNALLQQHAEGG